MALQEALARLGLPTVEALRSMAEVAVPRELFASILDRIQWFGVPPPLVRRG